jgi:hypothetical protein
VGTWGAGNFDNDSALDYMGEVEEFLINRIEEILADEDRCALDEDGEGVLMPTLNIMSVLHEHCRLGLPERETVLRWKAQYLFVFDEQIDGFDPKPGHREARRAIIEATFLKLEAQAWDFAQRQEWFTNAEEE